jgi:hypothetical protein
VSADPWLLWMARTVSAAADVGRQDVCVPADLGGLSDDGRMILVSRWRAALDVREVAIDPAGGTVRLEGLRVLPHDDADELGERVGSVLAGVWAELRGGLTVGDEIARGFGASGRPGD